MKIHIFGASGSGTTTLGRFLAKKLEVPHFDSDNYFWKKTDPPFVEKNSIPERQRLIQADIHGTADWILSGAMDGWGEPFVPLYDLVVFLRVPPEVRLARIKAREVERHGNRIFAGGDMYKAHLDFMEWAAQYDQETKVGRNLKRHQEWMATLPCQLLRIENEITAEDAAQRVIQQLKGTTGVNNGATR